MSVIEVVMEYGKGIKNPSYIHMVKDCWQGESLVHPTLINTLWLN